MTERKPVLAAYGIEFAYRGGHAAALRGASIELERGRLTAVLGPNGSGKSTLLKILSGLIAAPGPTTQVLYLGTPFSGMPPAERARRVAYVGADLRADFPLTAFETVLLGRVCRGGGGFFGTGTRQDHGAVQAAMEECRCWHLRDRELATLSGGERQLVALARAAAQEARVWLLDEALSRMDLDHLAAVDGIIRARKDQGYAFALVAHDWNLATEWADDCVMIRGGETLCSGPTREVVTEARLRQLYPGAGLSVAPAGARGAPKVYFRAGEGSLSTSQ